MGHSAAIYEFKPQLRSRTIQIGGKICFDLSDPDFRPLTLNVRIDGGTDWLNSSLSCLVAAKKLITILNHHLDKCWTIKGVYWKLLKQNQP